MSPADPPPENPESDTASADRAARRHELGHPDITEIEIGKTTHRVAEVQPMDVDGVRTMTVGTILWAVLAIALIPFWGTLREDGTQWWLWTALAGFGLGLLGIEYCRRRRNALEARQAARPSGGGGRRRK
ncbi:DUF2530 domain-containing protein [Aeromicrobium camelliae]|nr:DUF2530 domain-containing protein [Aeromicrobium camelliae]